VAAADYDVAILGGGHNGLVASYYLARAGLSVLVCERRDWVGGACATEELFPGYRVSSCAYICWNLQEQIVRDMDLERHGLKRTPVDPLPMLPFRDGDYLAFWLDDDATRAELARFGVAPERFDDWTRLWHRAAGLVHPFFLRPPPSLADIRAHAAQVGEQELLERLLTASIAELAGEYFDDPRVGAALMLICDVGDPYAPGSAWAEAWWHTNEHNGSVPSIVEGGMGALTQSMARSATEQGVTIRTGVEVEEIVVRDGRARGLALAGGEQVEAGIVLSNADPKRTFLQLVPTDALSDEFRRSVARLSTRAACLKFHAVLSEPLDLSPYLGAGFDPRYGTYVTLAPDGFDTYKRAWQEAQAGEPPEAPVCHIQVPTAYDSTLTDLDGEIVSIWTLYAPPRPSRASWDELREPTGERLIDHVNGFVPNFRSALRDWQLFTPADIEARTGITDGCIRHLDMIPSQYYDQRPMPGASYATPVEKLYLCGNGTHPGGEVTGAPGHNAAAAVLADLDAGSS
jgi:phytoene dehydrogenase-like protein